MGFDGKKLTSDLMAANKAASEAVKDMPDGGSANLDSVFLSVPRARETKVLEAISNAGLHCLGKRQWIGAGYFITPTGAGQGDTRYKAVQVMVQHLRKAGWDAAAFQKTD